MAERFSPLGPRGINRVQGARCVACGPQPSFTLQQHRGPPSATWCWRQFRRRSDSHQGSACKDDLGPVDVGLV